MFKLLLGVNGVGPKAALGVLAGITADELRFAVLSDDVKTLSKAPGIGKKTAQKLILELKDKLSLEEAFEQKLANEQAQATTAAAGAGISCQRCDPGACGTWLQQYRCPPRSAQGDRCGADGCRRDPESCIEEFLDSINFFAKGAIVNEMHPGI